jgi:hypothetical protein
VLRDRLLAGVALLSSLVLLGYRAWPQLTRRALVRPAVVARSKVNLRARSGPAPFLGPYGVQSRQVELENQRRGTTAWEIPPGVSTVAIQGFADHVYAAMGDAVSLYVSTHATRFRVEAFRMGYYSGTGARLVWQSNDVIGGTQHPCELTTPTNTVTCNNWTRPVTFRVTSAFVQGDYLLKLVASSSSGGGQSYVPLTIWEPGSHAAYAIKNDVFTWQAWNPYGGYDFYAGKGDCPSDVYPLCSRARIVSFDRPYGTGAGAGDFLGNEYPLVRFAEEHNLDVAYATDLTVQQHPSFLLAHRTLLSLGHDECWTRGERQAAVTAVAHGVNIVFFGASPVLRHVRLQASPFGPDRQEVDYRNASEDPLDGKANPLDVTANTWSSPPANWSENRFVGAAYAGFLRPGAKPADFTVADGSAWIFQGTGLQTGSVIPGLLRSDFDHFEIATHPSGEEILAHSRIPLDRAQSEIGTTQGVMYSDMTYYSDPNSGAGVLDTGTNNWIPALTPCPQTPNNCPAPTVRRITGNLLRAFGLGPAGRSQPPTSNWRQYY